MALAESLTKACPDAATFKELASKATGGLTDFGDPRLDTPLEALVQSFQQDAWPKMTPKAHAFAADSLVEQLSGRLQIIEDRKRYPEIAGVQVKKPIIVIGPPRSGSTLLHTLLSLDPDALSTPTWMCYEPSPPVGLGPPDAARLGRAEARLNRFLDMMPKMRMMHAYYIDEGAGALGEDGADIMVMAQTSKALWYFFPVDGYREYLLSHDHSAALGFHELFLQQCQWRADPAKHWALKAADHLVWLRELHTQYPDADLVWTHRDLAQQLGSCSSVLATARGVSGAVPEDSIHGLAAAAVDYERRVYARGMQAREELGEERFHDVSYHDLIADPVTVIQRVYARFGRQMSPQFAANVRQWVVDNPQTKHGQHKHTPDEFGLDGDAINRQFAAYTERYGVGFGIRPPLSV